MFFFSIKVFGALPGDAQGEWKCVALDSSHLALTGDYYEALQRKFQQRWKERCKGMRKHEPVWSIDYQFSISATEVIGEYRPEIVRSLQKQNEYLLKSNDERPLGIEKLGYWFSSTGQAAFPDNSGKMVYTYNALVAHFVFLTLNRPLAEGEKVNIGLPTGENVEFRYSIETPTPLFKFNQVGYVPSARLKFAYLGGWQGTAGAFPMKPYFGKPFELCDAVTGAVVHTGKVKARMQDPVTGDGVPFTGEEVAELRFSRVKTPGTYFLRVPSLGRSENFRIDSRGMAESFFIHARGLYHKRCGIAKTEPYTHWICPECHAQIRRGTFPPDESAYSENKDSSRKFGFYESDIKSIPVNRFTLIRANADDCTEVLHLPGGWHDAADCDRRQVHLEIVCGLSAVYMLRPGNFTDGQLNIPESGNGIPDILDEACWGLKHLLDSQQEDGGVSGWVETTRHPNSRDGLPSDEKLTYYLSCATRRSSIIYAATASELALALLKAGKPSLSETYRDSAKKAWDYAVNPANAKRREYKYTKEKKEPCRLVFYESPNLPAEYYVKAGFNLSILFNDPSYDNHYNKDEVMASIRKYSWGWSPLIWIEREIFGGKNDGWRENRQKEIRSKARLFIKWQEENYPYRIAWEEPRGTWVGTMGWGTFHPLRKACHFIAAYVITGEKDYLDAAYLAYDFHNGANPWGMTMTSGLGTVYPVRFLDLTSYADGIAEFVPGITPYRNIFYLEHQDCSLVHSLSYPENKMMNFKGLNLSLLPREGINGKERKKELGKIWPIWRRWTNIEAYSVGSSEYTVWETIAPAAMVTGFLLDGPIAPMQEWLERRPVDDFRKLSGYAPLP